MINMYCDQTSKFIAKKIWAFKSLLEFKQYNIYMWWIPSLNYRAEYLVFEVNGYHIIWILYQNLDYGSPLFVKKDVVIFILCNEKPMQR
jgi:hypothetical protein